MPDGDFNKITRLQEVFERVRVQDDLNNDMAGRVVGRIRRVAHDGAGSVIEAKKRRERIDRLLFETTLDALMRDPVYRKRHEALGQFLDTYTTATETALDQAIAASEMANQALRDALDSASTLNGRAVFVTDDGRIVYADGQEIDPAQAGDVMWRKGAATYEQVIALQNQVETAQKNIEEISGYQTQLDTARKRHQSSDNPFGSAEDMDAEQKRLEDLAPDVVTKAVEAEMTAEAAAPTMVGGGKPSL